MNTKTITMATVGALLLGACAAQSAPAPAPVAPVAKAPVQVEQAPQEPKVDAYAEAQWQQFLSERTAYLESLAEPLLACGTRDKKRDKDVFAHCNASDWPSLMQSAYALTKLAELTGDSTYAEAAHAALDDKVLRSAKKVLDHDGAARDPYAWIWLLAAAGSLDSPSPELVTLADRAAVQLETWLNTMGDDDMLRGVMFGAPDSVAWVAQNLWQWGDASGDAALAQRMREFTKSRLATEDYDEWCSLTVDQEPQNSELFPPCLHRVLAVLTVMPEDEGDQWLAKFLDEEVEIEPLASTWSTHAALNFSRSWGLWALYNATGDTQWRDRYVAHVTTQMQPQAWTSVKEGDRPWIAQFGVLAIGLSYAPAQAETAPGGTAAAPL